MVDEQEKKIILLVASLASFLVPYTGSSITVALPAMAAQFSADSVTLGWITSASLYQPPSLSSRLVGLPISMAEKRSFYSGS